MELKVYNWEHFERSKLWYFVFACIILAVVVAAICANNIGWGVLILVFTGWYLFYTSKLNHAIQMVIGKNALQIWTETFARNTFYGFVLEYNTETKIIQNIVFLEKNKSPRIYTISDTSKNLEKFVGELSDYLPMLDKYEQKIMDKFIRKMKL